MAQTRCLLTAADLHKLLIEILDKRPDIGIRYRQVGEMWVKNFLTVFSVSPKGAMFRDDTNQKIVSIGDLSSFMQFEIDEPFRGLMPYFHYEVKPLPDLTAVDL